MNSDKENIRFSPNEVRLTELSHSELVMIIVSKKLPRFK